MALAPKFLYVGQEASFLPSSNSLDTIERLNRRQWAAYKNIRK